MEAAEGRVRSQPLHAGLGPALALERAHEVHADGVFLKQEQTGIFSVSKPTGTGSAPWTLRSSPGRSAQDRSPELTGALQGFLSQSLPTDRATPRGSDTLESHVWTGVLKPVRSE